MGTSSIIRNHKELAILRNTYNNQLDAVCDLQNHVHCVSAVLKLTVSLVSKLTLLLQTCFWALYKMH